MDTNAIREAVLKRPFKPFILRMNGGREFYILHPEYVAVSRQVVSVIDHVSEAAIYLEPILISSLQYDDGEPDSNVERGNP